MQGGCNILLACLYVDDIIYMSSSQAHIDEFKAGMKNAFEMTNLDVLHYFLGLKVKQGEDGTFIAQKKYTKDLLEQFNMKNYKVTANPMNTNDKLQIEDNSSKTDAIQYRRLIGRLIHLRHTG